MAWIECKMGNTNAIQKNTPWYATCGTAQGTAAKVATTTDSKFALVTGAKVAVKFTYTNTATSPTLNVDSKGAKYIKAYGTTAPNIWWLAGDVVVFIYDGTNWIMQASGGQLYGTHSYVHEVVFNTNTLKIDVERVGKTVIFNIDAYSISQGDNQLFTVATNLKPKIYQRASACSVDGKDAFIYINTDGILGIYSFSASARIIGQITYLTGN